VAILVDTADMSTVVVPLVDGFEEIEAITIIDVLRRADIPVLVAGKKPGLVRGSHGIAVEVDRPWSSIDAASVAMVVLPGGMPGSATLAADPDILALIRTVAERGKVAAICAAPIALGAAGVVTGKTATCYPGHEERVTGANMVPDRVVVDGSVITGRGVGAAMEFALTLVGILKDRAAENTLERTMLFERTAPARVM
jgi:4-methyl-5(b-hydroxyethyl)-thiazole monophosphate biosynthesis